MCVHGQVLAQRKVELRRFVTLLHSKQKGCGRKNEYLQNSFKYASLLSGMVEDLLMNGKGGICLENVYYIKIERYLTWEVCVMH